MVLFLIKTANGEGLFLAFHPCLKNRRDHKEYKQPFKICPGTN